MIVIRLRIWDLQFRGSSGRDLFVCTLLEINDYHGSWTHGIVVAILSFASVN